MRYLGVTGNLVPDDTQDLRTIANFVRPRASSVLIWTYAILLSPMYVGVLAMYIRHQSGVRDRAVAQAELVTNDATAAAASQAVTQLNEGWAILVVGSYMLLIVFLVIAWLWNTLSLTVGGRDRNTGIATRGLLHSLRRGHEGSVIARRQLLQSLRKWVRSAERAGVHADTIEALSTAVTDPVTRQRGGDAHARELVVAFARQYDSGELIDPEQVTRQKSQVFSTRREVLAVLAGLTPLVGIIVSAWTQWRS